ncbi:MAG TPA: Glu-tRNA(Gln) amidotransferase subunit GatE [Candidatus Poseidoniales archaeon]|jgi:glutamyl-tRNA(Gln) amidotransferase subunit E|nr:MAG: Glu-tRNA(Gln) amidotransferase GatDE subunit E [Euryarchaeota archaeon]HIG34189.1 Glu-tRNA(Gln) amidotransferase subunit GatE [Candidatus Poseidoniales archaeon]HIL67917.1 Glu-tRNA(Gln) amidotransferase subunit GatE [Candidatus Poseidoniales archaeon]
MEPIGDTTNPESLDPVSLGFMCGLEIHQQLATAKLHSRMPSKLYEYKSEDIPSDWPRSTRRLRASQGESGETDVAARFEQRRNRTFEYVQPPNAGLIELDESPPRNHEPEAVDVVLTMAALMDAKPIPNLQTMRKTVVDGSNTSGFQRTTIVATGGKIEADSSQVGIDVISLEEDSARKLETKRSESGETVVYNLDRLGVPLVEVATAPDVRSPEHAKDTALALGRLLRDTRRVRRGLGSIRQDLNVSIACGDRVEIKGCQDLDWIPRIIRLEMARQLHFYRLANELRSAESLPLLPPDREMDSKPVENRVHLATSNRIPLDIHELTEIFSECASEMVLSSLEAGSSVLGVPLPGFSGRLGKKTANGNEAQLPRLGRELASAAKLAGVAGIFHSDELPAYGISTSEVGAVRSALSLSEQDAFVLCVAPSWQGELALESVVYRARRAFHRIPKEVRNVVIRKGKPEDGTTTALRPLPGGARMYPETDIPVLEITSDRWSSICENLPLTVHERKERLNVLELSTNQVEALLNGEIDDLLFQGIEGPLELPPKAWASALLETGIDKPNALAASVHLREQGLLTREGAETLLMESTEGPIETLVSWMSSESESRGFVPADTSSIEEAVDAVLSERADFIKERGMGAVGPLMGMVMQKLGGSADGKAVSQILRGRINEKIG